MRMASNINFHPASFFVVYDNNRYTLTLRIICRKSIMAIGIMHFYFACFLTFIKEYQSLSKLLYMEKIVFLDARQYIMKIIKLLLLSCVVASSLGQEYQNATGPRDCIKMSQTGCNVCYQYIDNSKKQAIFEKCQYDHCVESRSDGDGGSTCTKSQKRYHNEQNCFKKCCGSFRASSFSLETVRKCQEENQKMLAIGLGVGFGIYGCYCCIFLVIIIRKSRDSDSSCCNGCCDCDSFIDCLCGVLAILCCCICIKKCIQCVRKREENQSNQNQNKMKEGSFENLKPTWKYATQQGIFNTLEETNCAICLTNQVNVETNCAHYFHLDCILEWSRRNATCPLCISHDLNPVKFYCRICYDRYVEINLFSMKGSVQTFIDSFKGPNCPSCQ